jgi:hypothetical protein
MSKRKFFEEIIKVVILKDLRMVQLLSNQLGHLQFGKWQ